MCRQVDIGCNSCDRIVRTACEQQPMVTRGRSYSVPRSSSPAPLCCLITALDLTGGKTHPPLSPPAKSLSFSRGRVGIRKIEGGIPSPPPPLSLYFISYFIFRHSLRQHMLRHAGKKYKCGLPGCPTVLRTASELRSHVSLVHDATPSTRRYKCSDCTYAAKTRTQLRR